MSFMNAIKNILNKDQQEQLSSSDNAKQRLHILLIRDRTNVDGRPNEEGTPEFLPMLRLEILEVLKKYLPVVTTEDVEIKFENTDEGQIIEMSVSLGDEHNS